MRKGILSGVFVPIFCLLAVFLPILFGGEPSWVRAQGSPEDLIFDNGNIFTVYNGPPMGGPTTFRLQESHRIIQITNYHWNNGMGAHPGSIVLRDSSGNVLGRWRAGSRPGQGGVPNAYWDVYPEITLGPGWYTIVDSDPSTWSCNPENENRGMSQVYGYPTR